MSVFDSLRTDRKTDTPGSNSRSGHLLISFCNQTSSPDCALCILDRSDRSSRWIDLGNLPEVHRNNFSGVCGVVRTGGHVIVATQGASPVLATVDITKGRLAHYVALEHSRDPHSLVYLDGHIYIVSTGTNQIYRIAFDDGRFGKEELYWSYPGANPEIDEVHLNGLAVHGGQLLASCFGPRDATGSWGSEGRVFYLQSGRDICVGLKQPHSPVVHNQRLAVAESAAFKVRVYRKSGDLDWVSDMQAALEGYTRGLAFQDDQLLVGISASRELSRSQGQFLYAKPSVNRNSRLLAVDLKSGIVDAAWDLLLYGREPYDLCEVPVQTGLLAETESVLTRIRNMESWVARNAADMGSLFNQLTTYKTVDAGLVSVIIPTYNRMDFIGASIRSVLEQTYSNIELIVVDDGSTDDTESVVAAFSDPRFRYVRQPNRGRSNARNYALSLAKGKFITFLDSDDVYLPDKIRTQVNYLRSHPGTGMVYTSAYCIDARGDRLPNKYVAAESGLIYDRIAFFTPVTITLPTVMTYKEVFDQVGGFDEAMYRFEDTDMWRRISKHCRIDAMPEYTCLLRTHDDNSLLNQQPDRIAEALKYYAEKILREDTEVDTGVRRRGVANLYRYYVHAFMSLPQFSAMGKELLEIARTYDSIFSRVFPPDTAVGRYFWVFLSRTNLDVATYWIGRYAHAAFAHSLNYAYKVYKRLKRLFSKS
jgi:glycosyltransferase involved in cell wall biosynthesis